MTRDVLLVAPLHDATQAELESKYSVHRLWEAADRDTLLAAVAPSVGIVVTTGGAGAPRALIERLPRLGLIAC
ncbi:MAG TPA: 2-hydroxyacid dehydrogenase, partial [Burkholderiaceae bacterium]|nr:2-hydroxyacid dehydrogenase [Burkholderiaceae bacterium]